MLRLFHSPIASRHQSMLTLARSGSTLNVTELNAKELKMRWLAETNKTAAVVRAAVLGTIS